MRGELPVVVVVWWIAQDEVVAAALPGERASDLLAENGAAQLELVEVGVDRAAGFAVGLDEGRAGGAARQRLEPEGARAREQVEHVGVVDRTDQVEGVLADAVRRRASVAPRGRGNPMASM